MLSVYNSKFENNFAFQGGVAFLQNDGMFLLMNNTYEGNLALRASLFFLYNSQNELVVDSGYIRENGFSHIKGGGGTIELLRMFVKNEIMTPDEVERVNLLFGNNSAFL
jgi:hypothetical protein